MMHAHGHGLGAAHKLRAASWRTRLKMWRGWMLIIGRWLSSWRHTVDLIMWRRRHWHGHWWRSDLRWVPVATKGHISSVCLLVTPVHFWMAIASHVSNTATKFKWWRWWFVHAWMHSRMVTILGRRSTISCPAAIKLAAQSVKNRFLLFARFLVLVWSHKC